MQKLLVAALAAVSISAVAARTVVAEAVVGQKAPPFTATDTEGKTRSLGEFKGKLVVLEWWNPECPFVGKHYGSGNMQKLQREWTAKGVVWLTVDSSAPGQQGYMTAAEANASMKEKGGSPTAVLLDPAGTTGRAYGAKTTPHMFVVDEQGDTRVRRRDRRQTVDGPGGRGDGPQPRGGRARGAHRRQARHHEGESAVRLRRQVRALSLER